MKKKYISPSVFTISITAEGVMAQSSVNIPVKPDPGTPAVNKKDGIWGGSLWENEGGL